MVVMLLRRWWWGLVEGPKIQLAANTTAAAMFLRTPCMGCHSLAQKTRAIAFLQGCVRCNESGRVGHAVMNCVEGAFAVHARRRQ